MGSLEIDGFRMNFETHSGTVPSDCVFIHGNLASNRWWYPSVDHWVRKSESNKERLPGSLILAEWRGCGKSRPLQSEDQLDFGRLAQDYARLLDSLGKKNVHVVCHSTGSLIALSLALQAPHRIQRMVLLDPVPAEGFSFDPGMAAAFDQMRQNRQFCAAVLKMTIHECDESDDFFQALVDDAFHVDPLVWTGIPKALARTSLADSIGQLTHPILIIHGAQDSVLPPEGSRRLSRQLKNALYREIADHGHSLNVEDPGQFVSLVDRFLFCS